MKESIGRQWIHSESPQIKSCTTLAYAQQLPPLLLQHMFSVCGLSMKNELCKKKKSFCLCYRIFGDFPLNFDFTHRSNLSHPVFCFVLLLFFGGEIKNRLHINQNTERRMWNTDCCYLPGLQLTVR